MGLEGLASEGLIEQLVYEPCWDTLRTHEQLGYTVWSQVRRMSGVLVLCLAVQSPEWGPAYVASRIEAFLENFLEERLRFMSATDFERNRCSLLSYMLRRDPRLQDETARHWEQLCEGRHDFEWRKRVAECVRGLTCEDVASFYSKVILGRDPCTSHGRPNPESGERSRTDGAHTVIRGDPAPSTEGYFGRSLLASRGLATSSAGGPSSTPDLHAAPTPATSELSTAQPQDCRRRFTVYIYGKEQAAIEITGQPETARENDDWYWGGGALVLQPASVVDWRDDLITRLRTKSADIQG
ncbi:hypothetical protein CYMTET_37475 [Cymbomonas tetramitiformis]|uniref:Coenzyme PQQ synthesis protein F-like C-terminal lobe domain-containing protein n=1 Tax=Cymbomonas tetramitiformis TaxID=36881 RepID=A0AAE0F7I2_9CHLO|nr:hypothetical protein CYMTET_37475 [Cymbomonas tetramitiformis]